MFDSLFVNEWFWLARVVPKPRGTLATIGQRNKRLNGCYHSILPELLSLVMEDRTTACIAALSHRNA